jgi:hypothetical protein
MSLKEDLIAARALIDTPETRDLRDRVKALRYPGIAYACLLIALDNGRINRAEPFKLWQRDYERFIDGADGPLDQIDRWLLSLRGEQLETVCCGDRDDAEPIMAEAPVFTEALLNGYFEEDR